MYVGMYACMYVCMYVRVFVIRIEFDFSYKFVCACLKDNVSPDAFKDTR